MFNETVYNNTLTNLNGGVPVEAEDVGLENFVHSSVQPAQQRIQEAVQAEDNLETMKLRRYAQEKEQVFEAAKETGAISTNYLEELKYNKEAREKKVRELVHDVAKLGSAEQGVVDIFSLSGAILKEDKDKPLLGTDEANSLAKELGTEVKFDRPTSEAEVRWVVAKKQHEEKMTQELAYLSHNTNSSVMQDLMVTCSAISGAVGFYELAATAGLSILGGAGVARALGSFAGTANNVTKAVRLAQKAEQAQKRARMVGNVLDDAKYAAIARQRGFGASLAYDAYRFGKGVQGTHASLATTMIPFAVDGVVSDLPRIAALSIDSDITHSGRYTGQDVITELMMAGMIGGSLPAIGAGGRALKSARTKIAEGAVNKVREDAASAVSEAVEVGHIGQAEIAQQAGKETENEVRTLFEDLDNVPNEVNTQYADNVRVYNGANFTEAEHTFLMEEGKRRLALGLPMNPLFDQLPCKTPWFSTVNDMMNMLKEAVANKFTGHDFYSMLVDRGYTKVTGSLQRRLFPEGAAEGTALSKMKVLDDILSFVGGGNKFSIKLQGAGALEQKPIIGLTQNMMENLHFNMYKAKLLGDTEEGLDAALQVEEYLNNLSNIKAQIQEILDTTRELAKGGIPYREQNVYKLSNGELGFLKDALNDLADNFVPPEVKDALAYLKNIMDEEQVHIAEVGHPREEMLPMIEQYNQAQKIYQEYQDAFVNLLGETRAGQGRHKDTLYFNLRRKRNSDLAQLEEMNKNIDEMLNNADELYNSDLVFDKKYGDAAKVKKLIEDGEEIPELEYGYNHSSQTSAEIKEYIRGDEALERRNVTLQAELDSYVNPDDEARFSIYTKISKIAEGLDRMLSTGKEKKTSRFTQLNNWIEGLKKVVASDFGAEKSSLFNELKSSSALMKFIEEGLTPEAGKKSKYFAKLYREARQDFENIIQRTLFDPYTEATPGTLSFESGNIKEAVEKVTKDFFDNLGTEDAWRTALKTQADTATETAEDAANKIAAIDAEQKLVSSIADPVIKELKITAQKLQAEEMMNLRAMYNAVERCFDKNLGRVDELILGLMSGTYVNAKQGSVSVYALAKDLSPEYYKLVNLFRKETESTSDSVEDFVRNPNNWETLRQAMLDVERYEAGLMSEEEKMVYSHTRANTIAGRAARAYHKVLSDLAQDIYDLGASKYNTFNPFDSSKVRNLRAYLTRDGFSTKFFQSLPDDVKVRFQNHSNPGDANAALAFMEWLDLDKHFLTSREPYSFNELRDALVEGRYAAYAEKYTPEQLQSIWDKLYDRLLSDDKTGFVPKLGTGSANIEEEFKNMRSHYIDGLDSRFTFKNGDAYKEAVKYLGYDNFRQMFENNVSGAKKAWATMSLVGSDPAKFKDELVLMAKEYARTSVKKEFGDEAARLMLDRLGSKTFETKLGTLTTATCGNFTSPVSTAVKWGSMILQLLGAPLIMKSFIKGIADFGNMYLYLVSTGLAQNTSRTEIWKGLSGYIKNSKTNELLNELLISQPLMTNAIYEAATGAPTMVAGGNSLNDIVKGLTGANLGKYAKAEDKVAGAVKSLTDGVLKMGCVTTAAEKNRGIASMQLMRNIGREAGSKTFKEMDQRFQDMLGRYGIDEAEWDGIFKKHGVQNVDQYLSQLHGDKVELLGAENFFIPNNIVELGDDVVRDFMKAHPDKFPVIDDLTVRRYKTSLANKASILINDAADEMCCIPNARIRSMLLMDSDPNTRTGLAWRTITQFQSFGASLCWYHWGRRMMSFIGQNDNLFTRQAFVQYAKTIGGWGQAAPQALSFAGMVAECAFITFLINEFLSTITGTRQAFHDREGKLQLDSIGKKAMRAIIDQTGVAGVALDAVMGVFDFGRGTGGGLSLSVAPVPSSLISGTAKVAQAGMRAGNEGRRLQAIGAQTVSNILQTTGIPRHPFLQALYTMSIGDWLDQMSMGDSAYNRRYLRRYKENYMNPVDFKENVESIFTK